MTHKQLRLGWSWSNRRSYHPPLLAVLNELNGLSASWELDVEFVLPLHEDLFYLFIFILLPLPVPSPAILCSSSWPRYLEDAVVNSSLGMTTDVFIESTYNIPLSLLYRTISCKRICVLRLLWKLASLQHLSKTWLHFFLTLLAINSASDWDAGWNNSPINNESFYILNILLLSNLSQSIPTTVPLQKMSTRNWHRRVGCLCSKWLH